MRILHRLVPDYRCEQSSRDERHSLPGTAADSLMSSAKNGNFAIHTVSYDRTPWWQVAFSRPLPIAAVVIFNRERYRERAASLQLFTSDDGENWDLAFDNGDLPAPERIFGGIDTGPRTIWTQGLEARFLRIALAEAQILHLDAIEIYVEQEFADPDAAADAVLEQARGGAADIAMANLRTLAVPPATILRKAAALVPHDAKIGAVVVQYLAEAGYSLDAEVFSALRLPEAAAYASATKGHLQSQQPEALARAKIAYANLTRVAPEHPDLMRLHEKLLAAGERGSEQLIKLLIWDLDDTLWRGTLAEGDAVELFEQRRDIIIQAVEHGIINTVVSKNDPAIARAKLEEFGLLPYLIHPVIAFKPKGELIKAQIEALQLRAQNVLFIDDNQLNLHEAQFYCPKIQILDACAPDADAQLRAIIGRAKPDHGKRHADYRILARKLEESHDFAGDNEDFLRQSGIKILVLAGNHNFRFAARIEDLVNRSNQMNFLKSRIAEGTGTYLVGDYKYKPYSVFVRDRFGSYGLCGFACVEGSTSQLIHFAFSCRIMNMKVENVILDMIMRAHGPQNHVPVVAENLDYITLLTSPTPEFSADLDGVSQAAQRDIMIMANCQSGIIAHYLGLPDRTDAEQAPDMFTLFSSKGKERAYSDRYKILIYGIFVDYLWAYWGKDFTLAQFKERFETTLKAWTPGGTKIFLLLPPGSDRPFNPDRPELCNFADLNRIVLAVAKKYANVSVIMLGDFIVEPADVSADLRHYSRTLLRRIAEHLRERLVPAPKAAARPSRRRLKHETV